MKVIAIKNAKNEPLEYIEDILEEKGVNYDYVEVHETNEISKTGTHYIILGGPMGVYETEENPFLIEEMKFILECYKNNIPVLGICLGAQLMAGAFGEKVYPFKREIGWFEVLNHKNDELNVELPEKIVVFQWHGDTFDLPKQAKLLFEGFEVKNQGFRIGKLIALQFHLEVKKNTVEKWIESEKLNNDEKKRIIEQTDRHINSLHRSCKIVIEKFLNM